MKIPFEWVKDFVKTKRTAAETADRLSMAGTEISSCANNVLEVEVLPNRGDCLSVTGIAREICAIEGKTLKKTKVKLKEIKKRTSSAASVEVREKDLCPRYMARVIKGARVGHSPEWMQKRLIEAGMRPISSIVDVTNYVMLETGQPLHAFDLDLLDGRKIIVRKPHEKEKIVTLDGFERELFPSDLVIADAKKAVAIAGVMGGGNSEVSQGTTNILLESAYFSPVSINRTSKTQKLRTEASIRFEKGVDFDNVPYALDLAAALIADMSWAEVLKGAIDVKKKKLSPKMIRLRTERINKVLGIDVPKKRTVLILKGLGFKVIGKGNVLNVTVPLYRAGDIEREIDLIEEIARIYGYDKLLETYPDIMNARAGSDEDEKMLANEKKIREILVAAGFSEAKTYSLIGEKLYKKAGYPSLGDTIEIANPLIDEMTHLRLSLVPGLLEGAQTNANWKTGDIALFETGKVFKNPDKETFKAAGVLTGTVWEGIVDKNKEKIEENYYYLKGALENIFSVFGLKKEAVVWRRSQDKRIKQSSAAEIFLTSGEKIGFCGQLGEEIQSNFSLKKPVFIFEINLDVLNAVSKSACSYSPLPKYPSVRRDIAMFVRPDENLDELESTIRENSQLVEDVSLFDKFSGKDGLSLAYSIIYRDRNKTLTDEEVNTVHDKVVQELVEKFGVKIRK